MTDLNFGLYYPLFERTIDTNIDAMVTEMAKHGHKIVGVRADGASVNIWWKNELLIKWQQQVCDWLFKIPCFAHRLKLLVENVLNDIYSNIKTFLKDIYLHFQIWSKE